MEQITTEPVESKKSYKAIIVAIVVIAIAALGFIYWAKIGNFLKTYSPHKEQKQVQTSRCDVFKDDIEAYKSAMEKLNVDDCGCVKDTKQAEGCKIAALDLIKFQQIVKQLETARCKEFTDTQKQKTCALAITSRLEAMASDPKLIANSYLEIGNYAKASEVLVKLVAADAKDIDSMLLLATTYANQGLAEHKESIYVPKAMALINKAIALDANKPETYKVQGFVYEVKPDYEAAVRSYSKAIELNPNYILAYVGRGHAYNLDSRIGNALNDFKKAKELDKEKKYPQIYSQLCRLESQGASLNDALADCNTNAELSVGLAKAEAYGMLTALYLRAGRMEEANASVKMALIIAPNNVNVHLTAADFYIGKGDIVNAQKQAEAAIDLDKTRAVAYILLAKISLMQNNADAAIKNAQSALALVNSDVAILGPEKETVKQQCYAILADAYAKKGDKVNEQKYRAMKPVAIAPEKDQTQGTNVVLNWVNKLFKPQLAEAVTVANCGWIKIGETWCTAGSEVGCYSGNDCNPNTGVCNNIPCGFGCKMISYNNLNSYVINSYYVDGYDKIACPPYGGNGVTGSTNPPVYVGDRASLGCYKLPTSQSSAYHTSDWVLNPSCGYGGSIIYCGNASPPSTYPTCTSTTYSGACANHTLSVPTSTLVTGSSCVDGSSWCNSTPVAQITSPTAGEVFGQNTAINFTGLGTDADNDPLIYKWSIDNPNALTNGASSFSRSDLSAGAHTVYLQVSDATSNSTVVSVNFRVGLPTLNFYAEPTAIRKGETVKLKWEVNNSEACWTNSTSVNNDGGWTTVADGDPNGDYKSATPGIHEQIISPNIIGTIDYWMLCWSGTGSNQKDSGWKWAGVTITEGTVDKPCPCQTGLTCCSDNICRASCTNPGGTAGQPCPCQTGLTCCSDNICRASCTNPGGTAGQACPCQTGLSCCTGNICQTSCTNPGGTAGQTCPCQTGLTCCVDNICKLSCASTGGVGQACPCQTGLSCCTGNICESACNLPIGGSCTDSASCGSGCCSNSVCSTSCASANFSLSSTGDLTVFIDSSLGGSSLKRSNTTKIKVTPTGGFSGNVTLSLPSTNISPSVTGLTSSFPVTLTGVTAAKESVLYVSVPNNTTPGTKKLTIKGTSGTMSRTTELYLRVIDSQYQNK